MSVIYLVCNESTIGFSTSDCPLVYCKDVPSIQKHVLDACVKWASSTSDVKDVNITYYDNKIPSNSELTVGYYCVYTKRKTESNCTHLYELYHCYDKEYGWIRSDIRKRTKKVKGFIVYEVKRYQCDDNSTKITSSSPESPKATYDWKDEMSMIMMRIQTASDAEQKRSIAVELMEFMFQHRDLITKYPKLVTSVQNKLLEFYYDNYLLQCKEYYEKIFEEEMPSIQYHRQVDIEKITIQ